MLNRYSTPFSEGFYRALLSTGATFIVSTFGAFMAMGTAMPPPPDRWQLALMTGAISALGPFAVGTSVAKSDQDRADKSENKPADVPVAAAEQRMAEARAAQ
jgi:hypothetical protein